jgi:hypothetical protein
LDLAVFEGARSGLLDASDMDQAGGAMEGGASAAMLLFENRWAERFVGALRDSGAELVAAGYIPQDDLARALDAETLERARGRRRRWDCFEGSHERQ